MRKLKKENNKLLRELLNGVRANTGKVHTGDTPMYSIITKSGEEDVWVVDTVEKTLLQLEVREWEDVYNLVDEVRGTASDNVLFRSFGNNEEHVDVLISGETPPREFYSTVVRMMKSRPFTGVYVTFNGGGVYYLLIHGQSVMTEEALNKFLKIMLTLVKEISFIIVDRRGVK